MSQLRQQQEQLDRLKIQVKLVTFDDDFLAKDYVRSTKLEWPLLLDSNRELFAAYSMKNGSGWDLYNPISIFKYIGLIVSGQKPGRPGSDWHQLGGDVLIEIDITPETEE